MDDKKKLVPVAVLIAAAYAGYKLGSSNVTPKSVFQVVRSKVADIKSRLTKTQAPS